MQVVMVYPDKSGTESSDETKNKVGTTLKPAVSDIHNIRRVSGRGVLLETNPEDMASIEPSTVEFQAPRPQGPRLQVFDVPKSFGDKELLKTIYDQKCQELTRGEFDNECKFSFRTGPRDRETVNWVVTVSPRFRTRFESSVSPSRHVVLEVSFR